MKCDNCGKDIARFCYSIPQGVYNNRKPWALCSKKCMAAKIKKILKKKEEKNV